MLPYYIQVAFGLTSSYLLNVIVFLFTSIDISVQNIFIYKKQKLSIAWCGTCGMGNSTEFGNFLTDS